MYKHTFQLYPIDIVVFLIFVCLVVTVGLLKSKQTKASTDYFLAGRGLVWWLIGFSLIAANISTEQFVGMSGNAASHAGIAIASYEWIAAITLVIIAFTFLPYFLKVGIYTMPEFLEYRYDQYARALMAVATVLIYVLLIGSVTYSGALTIATLAQKGGYTKGIEIGLLYISPLTIGAFIIGFIAMIYVRAGGLKACAWADLIQGTALIIGGGIIMYFAFDKLAQATQATAFTSTKTATVVVKDLSTNSNILQRFLELNAPRLSMYLPKGDPILPWTALLLGIWIPNFYYWGLNQYITQRTLGSASLSEGQKGIVFAAFLKLLIPFVIVIPGLIAFNLYSKEMQTEARRDIAKALALYTKANPQTKFVDVIHGYDPQLISLWQDGKYVLVVLPTLKEVEAFVPPSSYIVAITKSEYDSLKPAKYQTFKIEDKAWPNLNPGWAAEVEEYNQKVEAAARNVGQPVSSQALITYKYDTALGQLIGHVLPQGKGLVGFVLAALLGAVVSSLAAMLNAASTIFAIDIYKKWISPSASDSRVVSVGRITVVVLALLAVVIAPMLGNPNISNSIFTIIQASQGFISPGVLAVFVVGLVLRRAPRICGIIGLITNIIVYGALRIFIPQIPFLNAMAISFIVCVLVLVIIRLIIPLPQPFVFESRSNIPLESSHGALVGGIFVIILTVALYVIFSPLVLAQ